MLLPVGMAFIAASWIFSCPDTKPSVGFCLFVHYRRDGKWIKQNTDVKRLIACALSFWSVEWCRNWSAREALNTLLKETYTRLHRLTHPARYIFIPQKHLGTMILFVHVSAAIDLPRYPTVCNVVCNDYRKDAQTEWFEEKPARPFLGGHSYNCRKQIIRMTTANFSKTLHNFIRENTMR